MLPPKGPWEAQHGDRFCASVRAWPQQVPGAATYPAAFREDVDHRKPDEPPLTIPKAEQEEARPQGHLRALPLPEQAAQQFCQFSKTIRADRLLKVGTMTFGTRALQARDVLLGFQVLHVYFGIGVARVSAALVIYLRERFLSAAACRL